MQKPPKLKAVYLEWEDSCSGYGWHGPDKDETSLIRTVGIEVSRTEKTVTVSSSRSAGGRYVDQLCIPLAVVRKSRRVRL